MNRKWNWQQASRWERLSRRMREHPRHEVIRVRKALDRLGWRYKERWPVWNELWKGNTYQLPDGGWQYLDFVVRRPDGLGVVLFEAGYPSGRPHLYEKRSLQNRIDAIKCKGLPVLVLKRTETTDIYYLRLLRWLKS